MVDSNTEAAIAAIRRGFQPVPIGDGGKRPHGTGWQRIRWDGEEAVRASFDRWREDGAGGVGLLLGEPSNGLIDIDLDGTHAMRLRDYFLPPSRMQTGRAGRPRSHRWFRVVDPETLPSTRRYKMPNGQVSVELRSTGSQTIIPPSIHPSGEPYRWEGEPWGGEDGPTHVDGSKLAIQVALLGLGAVLLEGWPERGSRHEAYLALAGGLIRSGDGAHPWWSQNLPSLIAGLCDATHDEDGAEARVSEVMHTTLSRLNSGEKAVGFPRLAEMIGGDHAEQARRMAREVESLSGYRQERVETSMQVETVEDEEVTNTLPPEERNPMAERVSSWSHVDLDPYLNGEVVQPEAELLLRSDGQGLMYSGRVNSIYGKSESGKTWIAAYAAAQEISKGERVLYLDFEDEPSSVIDRFRRLGVGDDDLRNQMKYVHPEDPMEDMQRNKFGARSTEDGERNHNLFSAQLASFDPTLIVLDGMNEIYGLHGHDTNDATSTSIVTSWIKKLTRGGRTSVVVVDHTGKTGGAGSAPIGAHHKIAMVQGTALRIDVITRPMPGTIGRVRAIVYKDRLGSVRAASSQASEQVGGDIVIDSRREGVTEITIDGPTPGDIVIGDSDSGERELENLSKSEDLQKSILGLFGGDVDKELKTPDVVDALDCTHDQVRSAWAMLRVNGLVTRLGERKHTRYRLAFPPDDDDDE